MKKTYILDTNILLASPNAIFGFEDNDVVITQTTLQELDSKKNAIGELGFNARLVIRTFDELREAAPNHDLTAGVKLANKGSLKIVADDVSMLPESIPSSRPDNRIIGTALALKAAAKKKPTILVTNDVSMRVIAASCGMTDVEGYQNDHISSVQDDSYTGKRVVSVADSFIKEVKNSNEYFNVDLPDGECLVENEFVVLTGKKKDDGTENKLLCIANSGMIKSVAEGQTRAYKVKPKNDAQAAALYALQAPVEDIPLVILKGTAGTAKTFLSLAAGLEKTLDTEKNRAYDRILITRANVMADADFGYLPGELDEKMAPLLAPFHDNLENLIRNYEHDEDPEQIKLMIEDLFETGVIDICPMAYMRGRSISNAYVIVSEAQNCTRSQIRDIITRAGVGTKIILEGDPNQVDNPRLDAYNNGLVFAAEHFKDSSLCAQITFDSTECVRSALAKEATDLLAM